MRAPRRLAAALAAAVFAAGCAGSRSARERRAASGPPADPRTIPEADARDLTSLSVPELRTVSFAYDSDHLDAGARRVLEANASYLKAHGELKVQAAGHCDERGTTAYNLALGQRRARAIRAIYGVLGVDLARVATISYGRERPLCPEPTEECRARNRRGETRVLIPESLAGAPAPSAVP